MIRIAILDYNSYLLDNNSPSNLQQLGFAATTELDVEKLSAWLAKHGVGMLILHVPNENGLATPTLIGKTNPELLNHGSACWKLNSAQLELIAPDGRPIPLSHNECCVLKAAANANGSLVSRRMLISALGQDFLLYDERRLESLVSRLRRKLALYAPEGFPIRGVKGQGYLFGAKLQEAGF
jgi:DNA-binding winged helix-turn-helix (wHTH) protein